MGELEGEAAFTTGAARGRGRSHAVRLAQQGADTTAVDLMAQMAGVAHPMATPEGMAQTGMDIEALERRTVASQAVDAGSAVR